MHVLSRSNRETGQVAEAGVDTMTMIDHYRSSITAKIIRELNLAICRGKHRLSYSGRDVYTCVESALSVEGVNTLAKRASDLTFHRPKIGRGICAQPVGGGRVASQAERKACSGGARQGRILQGIQLI